MKKMAYIVVSALLVLMMTLSPLGALAQGPGRNARGGNGTWCNPDGNNRGGQGWGQGRRMGNAPAPGRGMRGQGNPTCPWNQVSPGNGPAPQGQVAQPE